jgi:hypothetical protein
MNHWERDASAQYLEKLQMKTIHENNNIAGLLPSKKKTQHYSFSQINFTAMSNTPPDFL